MAWLITENLLQTTAVSVNTVTSVHDLQVVLKTR